MKARFRQRLERIESASVDWAAQLPTVDYIGLTDYERKSWKEVHHDQTITVYRNKETGEVRGVYADRRTDEEILDEGGLLEFV